MDNELSDQADSEVCIIMDGYYNGKQLPYQADPEDGLLTQIVSEDNSSVDFIYLLPTASDKLWPHQKELNIRKPSHSKLQKMQTKEIAQYQYKSS